jgi:hypothetical protein
LLFTHPMKQGWLLTTLRTALAEVPGLGRYPQPLFPTLPLLEATEFGQQHIITTFCLGPPPPTLILPTGSALPAVTLHLIWPQAYTYWQPETGTRQYVGGVRTVQELPAPYQDLLHGCAAQQQAVHYEADIPTYLRLLEDVLAQQWLVSHAAISMAEKATAMQLKQVLAQVKEPAYQPYYQSRGKALLTWIERATYEPTWAEIALGKALATTPAWLKEQDAAILPAPPFVAVLDGRPCLVAASYCQSASLLADVQLVAACYISYPEQEVRWRQFNLSTSVAPVPIAPPLPKLAGGTAPDVAFDSPLAIRRYLHLLSLVLARAWLVNRYPITPEEKTVATELQAYMALLFPPTLHTYYQQEAWQLLGWLAKVTN